MNSRIIYLVGSSGHPNFGDEFIAAAWLKYLAVARPDADVWLDCPQPGMAQVLFEGMHPRSGHQHALAPGPRQRRAPRRSGGEKHPRTRCRLGTPAYDLGILGLREAGSLHLIGGGYVNDTWPGHAGLVVGMRAVGEMSGANFTPPDRA